MSSKRVFPKKREEVLWRHDEEREETVIRALRKGKVEKDRGVVLIFCEGEFQEFNLLGAKIWFLCDGKHDIDGIIEKLLEDFDVTPAVLKNDVTNFIEELHEQNLITYEKN